MTVVKLSTFLVTTAFAPTLDCVPIVIGPNILGTQSRVGANAVVTRNVESFTTVMGIPAKVIKKNDKKNNKNFTPYGTPVDLEYDNEIN